MNARTIGEATWQFAQEGLLWQGSPEQISAYADISPATAYQQEIDTAMERLNN